MDSFSIHILLRASYDELSNAKPRSLGQKAESDARNNGVIRHRMRRTKFVGVNFLKATENLSTISSVPRLCLKNSTTQGGGGTPEQFICSETEYHHIMQAGSQLNYDARPDASVLRLGNKEVHPKTILRP